MGGGKWPKVTGGGGYPKNQKSFWKYVGGCHRRGKTIELAGRKKTPLGSRRLPGSPLFFNAPINVQIKSNRCREKEDWLAGFTLLERTLEVPQKTGCMARKKLFLIQIYKTAKLPRVCRGKAQKGLKKSSGGEFPILTPAFTVRRSDRNILNREQTGNAVRSGKNGAAVPLRGTLKGRTAGGHPRAKKESCIKREGECEVHSFTLLSFHSPFSGGFTKTTA